MKRNSIFVLIFATSLIFSGCSKSEKIEERPQEDVTASIEKTEDKKENSNENSDNRPEVVVLPQEIGSMSLKLAPYYELSESVEVDEEDTTGNIWTFSKGEDTLEISEFIFPDLEVDEDLIKEELNITEEVDAVNFFNIKTQDDVVFYGVLINDKKNDHFVIYHKAKFEDKVVTFMSINEKPYDYEIEKEYIDMIKSIDFRK